MSAARAQDEAFMRHALRLGETRLGRTWPNPAVGAVLVREGRVIGTGVTAPGGRPHGEPQALAAAGNASGATLYVTLEPCAHHGQTPPCTDAIIRAGVQRVVIGCADKDARVAGKGITQLEAAGIAVTWPLCEAEARAQHAGFFSRLERGRPFTTLKIATSLDGYIADAAGRSQWITGPVARAAGHRLRATHDAILTGLGTVLADNPQLTCRLPGLEAHSPLRVILDRRLRLPPEAACLPAWVVTSEQNAASPAAQALVENGATLIAVPEDQGHLSLQALWQALAARGVTRLLLEGGAGLSSAALRAGLVDRLYWFRAPRLLGGGLPAFAWPEASLASSARYRRQETRVVGEDILEIYESLML